MWHMRHLWVFIVPSFIVGFATVLRHASGPFWIGKNLDPEYAYLMNSLALTQGLSVGHSHHPGSTLQWAEAIWLYGIHFLWGKDELVTDVVTRPEYYLGHMHMTLLCILFFTLLMAGWLTYRWTGDIVAAFLMQGGILISFTTRNALSRMSPEPMLLILGIWLAITVLYHHHHVQQGSKKEPFWQYGLITGMGMGLKLTFLPLWFLPLVLLKRFRHLFFYLAITGIIFIILTANPLMNFQHWLNFTVKIFAREGYNQPLESGSHHFKAMLDGLSLFQTNIWQFEKPLLLLVVIFLAIGTLYVLFHSYRETNKTASWNIRLGVGLLLTLSGQIVLVANGPGARMHYLAPVLGLTGLIGVISWKWPVIQWQRNLKFLLWFKTFYLAIMIVITGFILLNLRGELKQAEGFAEAWQEAHRFKTDNHLLHEATVYYYRSSSKAHALSFGNQFARRHFSHKLSSLYPNIFHFFPPNLYGRFGEKMVTLDDMLNQAETVLIQGQNSHPPIIPSLEQTAYNTGETVPFRKPSNLIIPTKSPQSWEAEVIFDGSVEWIVLLRPRPAPHQAEEMHLKERH